MTAQVPSEFAWLRDLQRTLRLYEIRFGETCESGMLRRNVILRMKETVNGKHVAAHNG